jgi:hypothetical protein
VLYENLMKHGVLGMSFIEEWAIEKIIWNWKQQRNQVVQLLVGLFGGLGVVLGMESPRRGGGGPWWGCVGVAFLHGGISRPRSLTSPRSGHTFLFFFMHWRLIFGLLIGGSHPLMFCTNVR